MKITIRNDSKVRLHGLKPGDTRKIDVDRKGIPLDRNWRRRLSDSKIDGCLSVIEEKKTIKSKTKDDKGE